MGGSEECSMTDAMVRCMQQPGAIAVAFVELSTGRAIAGDGGDKIDIDTWTPYFTELLLAYRNPLQHSNKLGNLARFDDSPGDIPEIAVTTNQLVHLLYPLSHEGEGLYLYLALDRSRGIIPLVRRCLSEIDTRLHL